MSAACGPRCPWRRSVSWPSARRMATARSTTRSRGSLSGGAAGDLPGGSAASRTPGGSREVGDGNLNLVFIVEGPDGDSASSRRCPMCGWSARAGRCPRRGPGSSIAAASIQARHAPARMPAAAALRRAALPDRHGAAASRTSSCGAGMIEGIVYPASPSISPNISRARLFYTSDLAAAGGREAASWWRRSPATPSCARSPRT